MAAANDNWTAAELVVIEQLLDDLDLIGVPTAHRCEIDFALARAGLR